VQNSRLGRREIVLTWPNTDAIAKRIETVLRHDEEAGIEVYEATIEYIAETAKRLIDELTPDWFPVDGAELEPQVKEDLLSSLLPVPVSLKLDNFKGRIKDALWPLEVTEDRINEALRKLQGDDVWHALKIQHGTTANADPPPEIFVCAGRAPPSQSPSPMKNARGDPGMQLTWDENDERFLTGMEAVEFSASRLSLSKLSKLCRDDGSIRYMRRPDKRLRVHVADLRQYLKTAHPKDAFDGLDDYVEGVETRKAQTHIKEKPGH